MKNKGKAMKSRIATVDIDFLENETLSCEERMVFIALRSFMERQEDRTGTLEATLDKISRRAGMSRPRAARTINKLIENGLVIRQRRGLTLPNIYTVTYKTEERKRRIENEE